MMNPVQKTYFKYIVIILILWIANFFFNPFEGVAVILNWAFLISFAALILLYFDARKQYDKEGNKVNPDGEIVKPVKEDVDGRVREDDDDLPPKV
ncbi:MAG TPA: hypothetical protein K8V35_00990 [Aliicoccus persicus]|uniref:Uncharacterized protein n=1 Tax=Aliicoccus persicus TaxID=930138 RepID=A0A921B590_9STAP|nr:hypothetical protein [Aliicoccus persicus]